MLKKIEATDLYELKFLSDVNYSPDGKKAVFTVHRMDEKANTYLNTLWLMDTADGAMKPLVAEGKSSKAYWEDNDHLVFASATRAKAEKGKTAFYRIDVNGGEAEPLFVIPETAATIKALGNDKYLIACRISHAEKEDERPDHAKIGVDFDVFDELPFWFNGEGVTNKTRDIGKIFDAKTGELKSICDEDLKGAGVAASPDGKLIAYCGCMLDKGVFRQQGGLWLYNVETGETKTVVPQGDYMIGTLNFWGNDLFFTRNDHPWPGANPVFCLADLDTLAVREMPFADCEAHGGATTDASYGGGRGIKVMGDFMYMIRSVRDDVHIVKMAKDGATETIVGKAGSVAAMDIFENKILYVGMRDSLPCELYSFDMNEQKETKLSAFNEEYVNTHNITKPSTFSFTNSDGWELDGYVLPPAGYEPGKKYPGILEIHGGPKGIYSDVFNHEMQVLCSRGFFVFYTNPRGGDGRGNAFADITGQLGGIDFNDLMEFTEETLKRYPDIDQDNLACCGGSYGGFMANWMVGHTTRFKAACAQRSISNYLAKPFTTDIGYYHNIKQLAYTPWESFDKVWENSPLKNAPLATAATLFIQSDQDFRCWQTDALQMFMAMRARGVDCRMCLFKGENHNLSRTGKPQNRVSRITEIADWFDSHLK